MVLQRVEGTDNELKLIKHTILLFAYSHNEYLPESLRPDKLPFNLVSPTKKQNLLKFEFDMTK